ncbi:Hypothetical predicted protein [Pelobates cultripes]|uniref:Uncharacterized protein n=1 Tax=Pelobates cultripes TaxID=61616 RepID=A0AAD1SSA8_PELCU|nr:Hypothetical predicted protein [Pelobates cultripes]
MIFLINEKKKELEQMDKDIKEMKDKLIPEVEDGTYVELLDKIERRVKDLEIQVKTTKHKKLMRDKEDYNLGRQRNWRKHTFNTHDNHHNNYPPYRQYQPRRLSSYQNYRNQSQPSKYVYPSRSVPQQHYHHSSHLSHKDPPVPKPCTPCTPLKKQPPSVKLPKHNSPPQSSRSLYVETPSSPSFLGTFLGRK